MSKLKNRSSRGRFTSALIAGLFGAVAAQAQDVEVNSAEGGLEELVVTAQKRTVSVQQVPVAVSAFSGEILENAGITATSDLVSLAPSLTYAKDSTPTFASMRLRGAGTLSFSAAVEPSVSVLFDGVVMNRPAQGITDLADIERIEVLRGPQGTLFGKNASAGAIQVITKRPSEEFEGNVEISATDDDEYRIKGSVSGPLSDTVGYRLSGHYRDFDGFIKNLGTGNTIEGTENWGLRGKLEFQPSDDLNILVTADAGEEDRNCCIFAPEFNPNGSDPDGYKALISPAVASEDSRTVNMGHDPRQEQEVWGASVEINYEFDWGGTLTSITSYRDWEYAGASSDFDGHQLNGGIEAPGMTSIQHDETEIAGLGSFHDNQTFSQELRLTSPSDKDVEWILGLFYWDVEYYQKQQLRNVVCNLTAPATSIGPCSGTITNQSGEVESFIENNNMAAYGFVNWHVTDRLDFFAGARVIQEDLEANGVREIRALIDGDSAYRFRAPLQVDGSRLRGSYDETVDTDDTGFAGKVGLKYEINENVRVFASYARGYKGPAANVFGWQFQLEPLDPEIVDSYEIGLKSELMDNRVHLNVTAFYSEFSDYHSQSRIPDTTAFVLTNAAEFVTQGLEFEMDAAVTDNLTVSVSAAYTDAYWGDFEGARCHPLQTAVEGCITSGRASTQDLTDRPSPNSPDWKLNLGARYEFPVGNWSGFVQGNYTWQDEVYYREDLNPESYQGAYGLMNLRLGASSPNGRFTATLFAENLFDEDFAAVRVFFPDARANDNNNIIHARNVDRYYGAKLAFRF